MDWNLKRRIFTLIELLVVIAIIAILVSMLLPSLRKTKELAKSIGCINNLKSLGTSIALYGCDWNGFLIPHPEAYAWENNVAPYVGMKTGYVPPKVKAGTVFTCPSRPEGTNNGNYPSFARSNGMSWGYNNLGWVSEGTWGTYPYRIDKFKSPSSKVGFIDSGMNDGIHYNNFYPNELDNVGGATSMRHNMRTNMVFLDGHANTYGYPPLPRVQNSTEANKWISCGSPSPEGL